MQSKLFFMALMIICSGRSYHGALAAEASYVAEITFTQGQKKVPSHAKNELRNLFDQAQKKGGIKAAKIITWADKKSSSGLGSDQLKLVEDRSDNVEAYLEILDLNMNVNKISMAEPPGVMESILSPEDIKLKKSFETASKASKSVVMFILKKGPQQIDSGI